MSSSSKQHFIENAFEGGYSVDLEYEGGQSLQDSSNNFLARSFRSLYVFGPYGDQKSEIIENQIGSPLSDVKILEVTQKRVDQSLDILGIARGVSDARNFLREFLSEDQLNMLLRNQTNMLSFNEPVENGLVEMLETLQDHKNMSSNLGQQDPAKIYKNNLQSKSYIERKLAGAMPKHKNFPFDIVQ